MASASRALLGFHTSAVFRNGQKNAFRLDAELKHPIGHFETRDLLPEHATAAVVLNDPQAHILLRVINDGYTLELLSLATDVAPIRFGLPAPVLPDPAVVFDDLEIHVIACTSAGYVLRLVFPLPHLWNTQYMSKDWRKEYKLQQPIENVLGPVHVKEAGYVLIGLNDGGILQLDTSRRLGTAEFQVWRETVLRPPLNLNLSSFIPFSTRPQLGSSNSVAFASAPPSSPSLVSFSIQRDRVVRVWESGSCVATTHVPAMYSNSPIRGSSGTSSRSIPILEAEPRPLLRVIIPEEEMRFDEGLKVMVYMPSSAGGYFSIFVLSGKNSSGARALEFYGQKFASEHPRSRSLRDFVVNDNTLWVLWDDEGMSHVESTSANFEDDEDGEVTPWVSIVNPRSSGSLPVPMEDQSSSHSPFTGGFLEYLLRPGAFSVNTLRAALEQYSAALATFPGNHKAILSHKFSTLEEHIAAVVGCSVNLNVDAQTGAQQWNAYWAALRRDWEGFVARCRDIERSARWPLAFGRSMYSDSGPLILERERISIVVKTDGAMQFHERECTKPFTIAGTTDPDSVMHLAVSLRSGINSMQLNKVDTSLLTCARQEAKSAYPDLASDLSRRDISPGISDEFATYLDQRIDTFTDLESAITSVLDIVTDLDTIKLEDDEQDTPRSTDLPQFDWQRALTASYISASTHARYDIILSLLALICYVADARPQVFTGDGSVIGEAFAALQCVSTLYFVVRRTAGDVEGRTVPLVVQGSEDVASLMTRMHVSSGSGRTKTDETQRVPTYSLLYSFLASSTSAVLSNAFTQTPSVVAHRYLSDGGILRGRDAPGAGVPEAKLLHQLWIAGHTDLALEMVEWFPSTPAITYVSGRILLDTGRVEDAATRLETVEHFIGGERDDSEPGEDSIGLASVLPMDVGLDSPVAYYRHLVSLFERSFYGEQVIYFARLAIKYSEARDTRDLWCKIHKTYLDLGLYDDAYVAMASTSFSDLQRELTRNLVNSLCDNEQIDKLIDLNFIGYQADVEETLLFKARNSDPRSKPYYSEVLHAWYVFRGDFRSAAASMYQHGRRLGVKIDHLSDIREAAAAQAKSYLAAINALSLVNQRDAWIQYSVPTGGDHRRHQYLQQIPEEHFRSASLDIDVVTLSEIRREYAFILAQLQVYEDAPELPGNFPLTSEEIVSRFIQVGKIDSAMATARSLNVNMNEVFTSLAAQCMRLAQQEDDDFDHAYVPWLLTDQASSWEGTTVQRAWRLLRTSLEAHDSLENDWGYYKAVLHRILDIDADSRVPAWLVKFFEDNQPEYLVRTFLKYELVHQTLVYCLAMVQKANIPLLRGPPTQASSTWLPYTLVDQVLMAAASEKRSRNTNLNEGLVQQLREAISTRTRQLKR